MLVLPYTFSIRNSDDLIKDLNNIDINTDIRICSFDINNMYSNIPTYELINIITSIANGNDIHEELIKEIKLLTELIIKRNYFELNSNLYLQSQGLAMGATSSALLSELYLQRIEHNQILNLLIKHKIISYHRYVDDILIVYNTQHTNINNTLNEFNNIHRKIQFSTEAESNNIINFLDISIVRTCNNLKFDIFINPTATDIMIHNMSFHPIEHQFAGINYLINRITTYPITEQNVDIEEQNINHLLKANGYHNLNSTELIRYKQLHINDHKNKDKNITESYKIGLFLPIQVRILDS
jgi:hypothetical protein